MILGPTGKNFAAGMSGGIAYVLDEKHDLYMRLNKDQVMTDTLTEPHDIAELRSLIEAHVAATGSPRGKKILAAFHSYVPCFKKVMPRDYDRMLRSIAQYEEKGHDPSAGGDRGVLRQYQSLRGGWTTWENPPDFWNIPAGRIAAGTAAERVRDWEEFHLPLPEEDPAPAGRPVHELRRPLLPGGR